MQRWRENILINKTLGNITIFLILNGKRCAAEISNFTLTESDKIYYFNRLIVHNSLRNKGIAKALMTELISVLDTEKITFYCDINPYGDLNLEQLILFYQKFGFVKDNNNNDQLVRYAR